MKNIFLKIVGSFAVFALSVSCIQETFPEGAGQTAEQVSKSTFALEGILRGLPTSLTATNTAGYYSNYGVHTDFGIGAIHLMTENMLGDFATAGDNPYYNRFYSSQLNEAQGEKFITCAYYWDCYYMWIKIANDLIAVIDPASATEDQRSLLGQALAYRATFYLDLARMFEAKEVRDPYAISKGYVVPDELIGLTVPIITEKTTEKEAQNNPRVKREDMYAFILKDLEEAATYLTGKSFDYKAPSIQYVNGLMARAYLEMGYWDDENSNEYFTKAIAAAQKAREGRSPLTKDQWTSPTNGFNNGSDDASKAWILGLPLSSENQGNIICYIAHISTEAAWGYATLSKPSADRRFYEAIPDSDWRKLSWLHPDFVANPEDNSFGYQFSGNEEQKKAFFYGSKDYDPMIAYQNIKFRPAKGIVNNYTEGNCADHCLMRVEEMFFIEAEAQAHLNLGQAKQVLENLVKTRNPKYVSQASDLESFLTEDLLFQKRIEFWGEGILYFDYKRLDVGFTRGYEGTNHAAVYRLNCVGRSPQWNFVITRTETQGNNAINEEQNNPDPSETVEVWKN